jgi:hypothetical protein
VPSNARNPSDAARFLDRRTRESDRNRYTCPHYKQTSFLKDRDDAYTQTSARVASASALCSLHRNRSIRHVAGSSYSFQSSAVAKHESDCVSVPGA